MIGPTKLRNRIEACTATRKCATVGLMAILTLPFLTLAVAAVPVFETATKDHKPFAPTIRSPSDLSKPDQQQILTASQSPKVLYRNGETNPADRPGHFEYPSVSTGSNFYYVDAFASGSDPSAVPNSGIQGTIQVVSQQTTGCLSFWVDDDGASNLWGQVGYYICNSSTPIAFYQIWNLNNSQVLTTGTTSVSDGYHQFSMYSENAGNTWAYALDGNIFGRYNMEANVSSPNYGISATTEEGYVNSPYQPAQSVEFSPALEVMQFRTWNSVHKAYEASGCGNNSASCWGIQGNLQNPSIPTDTIIVGGTISTVGTGTLLWNSGNADFTMTVSPTSLASNVGVASNATIRISPVNGFTSTVTLAVATNSTNLSCTLSSTSILGGSGESILSCVSTLPGTYLANVTGTGGTLSRSASAVYHSTSPPSYTLTVNPATVTASVDVSGNSTITITPQNGFTGTITLTVITNSTSLSCTLSSTTVTPGGSSNLSCKGSPASNYLATIRGTGGGIPTQTTSVTFQLNDFIISSRPPNVGLMGGVSGTSIVSIAAVNGFSAPVALTYSVFPSTGLSCGLNPTVITNGSGSSTITCTVSTSGIYTIIVDGVSGSLTHSTNLTCDCSLLNVQTPSNSDWLVVGTAAVLIVLALTLLWKRKHSTLGTSGS